MLVKGGPGVDQYLGWSVYIKDQLTCDHRTAFNHRAPIKDGLPDVC